jgi:hypothetical protein
MPLKFFTSSFRFHELPPKSRLHAEMPLVTQFVKKSANLLKPKSLLLLSQEPASFKVAKCMQPMSSQSSASWVSFNIICHIMTFVE